jgi:5-methylcytosine-specific restriction endonuclease McrA
MKYKKQQIRKKCIECGNDFIGKSTKVYCSSQCFNTAESNRFSERRDKKVTDKKLRLKQIGEELAGKQEVNNQKICEHCHNQFITNKTQMRFCSYKCRIERYEMNRLLIPYEERIDKSAFLKLRFELFKRDNFQCQYCGRTPKIDKCKLVIEHIIPRAKGGTNDINNLTTSCFECNAGKIDVLLEERQLNKIIIEVKSNNIK